MGEGVGLLWDGFEAIGQTMMARVDDRLAAGLFPASAGNVALVSGLIGG
jgi:hypothetical protein